MGPRFDFNEKTCPFCGEIYNGNNVHQVERHQHCRFDAIHQKIGDQDPITNESRELLKQRLQEKARLMENIGKKPVNEPVYYHSDPNLQILFRLAGTDFLDSAISWVQRLWQREMDATNQENKGTMNFEFPCDSRQVSEDKTMAWCTDECWFTDPDHCLQCIESALPMNDDDESS